MSKQKKHGVKKVNGMYVALVPGYDGSYMGYGMVNVGDEVMILDQQRAEKLVSQGKFDYLYETKMDLPDEAPIVEPKKPGRPKKDED